MSVQLIRSKNGIDFTESINSKSNRINLSHFILSPSPMEIIVSKTSPVLFGPNFPLLREQLWIIITHPSLSRFERFNMHWKALVKENTFQAQLTQNGAQNDLTMWG